MAIYYVRATDGNDADTGLTVALAWATIQKALDTAVAGDTVLICNDANHVPVLPIGFDTNAGTGPGNQIIYRGCAADGTDDGTVATIHGGSIVGNHMFEDGAANSVAWTHFENLKFDTCAFDLFHFDLEQRPIQWVNCEFTGATRHGVYYAGSATRLYFYNCEIHHNTGDGIGQSTTSRGYMHANNCAFHDNGESGLNCGVSVQLFFCSFTDNGIDGLRLEGGGYCFVNNCVFHANTGDGIHFASGTATALSGGNNIFHSNGGWGVNLNSIGVYGTRGPNLYYNNTAGAATTDGVTDEAAVVDMIGTPITGDPQFAGIADGYEDYAIPKTSPAFQTGLPGTHPNGNVGYVSLGLLIPDEPDVESGGIPKIYFGFLPITAASDLE